MTRTGIVFSAVILLVCSGPILTQNAVDQRPTPLVITRLFTGPDGLAHAERVSANFASSATLPTRGLLDAYQAGKVSGDAVILRTSPDYFSDGRAGARRRQYVIMLSGRREIEVAGGRRIAVEPGNILLVEDTTGRGHSTRGVGTEDAISIVIPLGDEK